MNASSAHLNFEIEVRSLASGLGANYIVSARSQVGRVTTTTYIELSHDEWNLFGGLLSPLVNEERQQSAKRLGQHLFNALFSDDVRTFYYESLRLAKSQRQRLRIVLDFQDTDLGSLPWEVMYDERNTDFVCLNAHTQVMRYASYPHPVYPMPFRPPLQVLCFAPQPKDVEPLDIAREKRAIAAAVNQYPNALQVSWVQGGTWQDIKHSLQIGEWHVLHFVGHGFYAHDTGEAGVILAKASDGHAEIFGSSEFARLIADHSTLGLVVLSAADTAAADRNSPHSSLAASLLRRGIPAVIGMQVPISDSAGVEFAEGFYSSLARSFSIDEAISETRRNLSHLRKGSVEWAVPLYLTHSPTGEIWRLESEPAAPHRRIRILILAANPTGLKQLRLAPEVREIDEALIQKAAFRDRFEIMPQLAVSIEDLQSLLLRFQPDIVHFTGHGYSDGEDALAEGGIILEDAEGNPQQVPSRALGELFAALKSEFPIRCVFLNACYSALQAKAIAEHVDCVIGMPDEINDSAGISFAKSFYQAIGFGLDVDKAFQLGKVQVNLEDLNEQTKPQLLAPHSDPSKIKFVVD